MDRTTIVRSLELEYIERTMLESKLNATNVLAGRNIRRSTDRVSELLWLAPVLTYEGIILLNPLDENPQTFSEWSDAEQELLFYKIHRDIELHIYPSIRKLIGLLDDPRNSDTTETIDVLDEINAKLEFAVWKMGEMYRSLNKEAFSRFRPFFSGIESRSLGNEKYPGPSWASSCIFPTLDILLGIEKVAELSKNAHAVRPALSWNWYTTVLDMKEAEEKTSKFGNLYDIFAGNSELLWKLNRLTDTLRKFRMNHQWNVKKYLPQVFEGAGWTGWATNVPEYLGAIIHNTKSRISL